MPRTRLRLAVLGLVLLAAACGGEATRTTDPSALTAATTDAATIASTATEPAIDSTTTTDQATGESTGTVPGLPVIADDEPRYVFNVLVGAGGGVLVTRLDGTDVVELGTDVPGVLKRSDWSPDGQRIVLVEDSSETLWIAHLDGSASTRVAGCDHDGCDYPAWSPDGTKLAYSRSGPQFAGGPGPAWVQIEVLDLASGEVTVVTHLERPLLADIPRWSPDGTQLAIGVDRMDDDGYETGAAVAVVPVGGGELTYLTDFGLFGYSPDWNAVTREIVFGTSIRDSSRDFSPDETWEVWAVQPDGSGLRQVTHSQPGVQYRGRYWTPDGSAILALSSVDGAVQIDPTTGEITPLPAPPDTGSPRLRPSAA